MLPFLSEFTEKYERIIKLNSAEIAKDDVKEMLCNLICDAHRMVDEISYFFMYAHKGIYDDKTCGEFDYFIEKIEIKKDEIFARCINISHLINPVVEYVDSYSLQQKIHAATNIAGPFIRYIYILNSKIEMMQMVVQWCRSLLNEETIK